MSVRISCIIPTFNRGAVLCDSIKGLLNQTLPAHEIIVVDQSPSQPPQIQTQVGAWKQEGKLVWIQQKDPNASAARNLGARHATGDILLFLDDDIEVQPCFLSAYATEFIDSQIRGVAGQVLEGDMSVVTSLPDMARDEHIEWLFFPRNYAYPAITEWLISCNVAVRREDFFEVGGMDENYPRGAYREEADFGRRWARSGRKFHFRPSCSLHHLGITRVRGGGARNWTHDGPLLGYHHYIGEWYFFLGFVDRHNWWPLITGWIRSAGLTKKNLRRPWWIPVTFVRWISALPLATWRRFNGPILVSPPPTNAKPYEP